MNLRDAKRLQPGAIVGRAWFPGLKLQGIVLSKDHIVEKHRPKLLGGSKDERYDITVHWLGPIWSIPPIGPRASRYMDPPPRVQVRQNWELMIVSHVSS